MSDQEEYEAVDQCECGMEAFPELLTESIS